jgi:hypothetical protein
MQWKKKGERVREKRVTEAVNMIKVHLYERVEIS